MKTPLRILHLEDNPKDAELVQATLQAEGIVCEVMLVQTREDYLAATKQSPFDLILADYSLPQFDGLSALAIRQEHCPDVPYIFVSGTMAEEVTIESLKSGATDYVLKNRLSRLAPAVRRALEEKLLREENRAARKALVQLVAIVESSDDAIIGTALDDTIFSWNSAAERIYGYSAEEAKGRHISLIAPPDRVDEVTQIRERFTRGELVSHFETVRMRKDGKPVHVSITVSPIKDEKGNVIGSSIIARDLSERKRAEEKMRLQSAALESAANAVVITDRDGIITWVNPAFTKFTGYSPEEAIGQNLRLLKSGVQDQPFYEKLWNAILSGEAWSGEIVNRRKDGVLYTEEQTITPVCDAQGEVTHFIAIKQNITERKAIDERLRQSDERFRSMIENVKDHAIYMLNVQGCVLTWNKGAERFTGYQSEEIIGKHYRCFYPIEDRESGMPEQILKAVLAEGQWHDEGWHLRKDGSQFWANVVITAARNGGAKLLGFSVVTRDLTQRRKIEEQLRLAKEEAESANEAKSAFLVNISHEIRTPMTGILGMAGFLSDTELSSKQAEYCQIIQRSSESLLRVINDVLDFSKVESGKLELEIIDFDLTSAVGQVIDLFAKQAEDKGVELINFIRYDVPEKLQGDPGRLRQVISNLVGNALKFTAKGEVVVRITVQKQTATYANLRFEVSDTGMGIPKEKQDELFNAFTQVDASTTRKYGGTGLGLAICKKYVELMGGQIGMNSEPEKGTTVWFTLTLLKRRESVREAPRPRTNLHGLRMLVVEGNATNRTVLEHYLSSLGIVSRSAEDGPTALELLSLANEKDTRYDLAILAFRVPNMDGLELARTIRQNPKFGSPKLLLLSSVGKRGDAKLAREAGIDGYLTKPFSLSNLFECLALLMGEAPKGDDSNSLVTLHKLAELKSQTRLRVLVADDNHINQKVIATLLGNMGHWAEVVGDGKQAVEAYEYIPYDVVLMDLQMPEIDGFEASRQIRTLARWQGRHTSIIAITAHARKEDREKCLASGFDDYISKPINPEELRALVGRIAKRKEPRLSVDARTGALDSLEVLNLDQALAQIEGNKGLLAEIFQIFRETAPQLLDEIRRAVSGSKGQSVAGTAHFLASSLGQLGAQRASVAAKRLEKLAETGEMFEVPDALAELERELAQLKPALSDHSDFTQS